MAKAYGMWAGEEPYNCTKRGTVVIDRDGKIAHYEEVADARAAQDGRPGADHRESVIATETC